MASIFGFILRLASIIFFPTKKVYLVLAFKTFCFIALLFSFTSCVNDLENIKKVASRSDAPEDVTENLEIIYTDSGYAKFQLYAKLAETYVKPMAITKLKDGLKINFFDDTSFREVFNLH